MHWRITELIDLIGWQWFSYKCIDFGNVVKFHCFDLIVCHNQQIIGIHENSNEWCAIEDRECAYYV